MAQQGLTTAVPLTISNPVLCFAGSLGQHVCALTLAATSAPFPGVHRESSVCNADLWARGRKALKLSSGP